jgi:dihydrofolate synthase / folylpolyglutamate synthase
VVGLARRLKSLIDARMPDMNPTFFEFTTAMAMDYFARAGAEVVVLEVGMGGRLDSTNVVTPECSVITNVELEHREYLGQTLPDIAHEKAGIIKPGVPLVTSEKKPEVIEFFADVCRKAGSPMFLMGRDFGFTDKGFNWEGGRLVQRMDYFGPGGALEDLEVPLAGRHQLENAATAACALGLMKEKFKGIDARAVRDGFRKVSWQGRLEVVSDSPLLVLDGAHNPASAARLADAVRDYFRGRYKRLILVVGALADKDFGAMLDTLTPLADRVVLTQARYERAVPAAGLAALAGEDAVVMGSVEEAIGWALREASAKDMVLVTGSLYVVGEAKAWLGERVPFLRA